MVVTKPGGLGKGATFAFDQNPAYRFANASFTKGGFDAGVWDNGKLPNADILTLARKVYARLPVRTFPQQPNGSRGPVRQGRGRLRRSR
jgi:hypothetical protein